MFFVLLAILWFIIFKDIAEHSCPHCTSITCKGCGLAWVTPQRRDPEYNEYQEENRLP